MSANAVIDEIRALAEELHGVAMHAHLIGHKVPIDFLKKFAERMRALASRAAPLGEGDDSRDAELWRKHKDSFSVLQAILEAASPLVLNKLKAQDAAIAAMSPQERPKGQGANDA